MRQPQRGFALIAAIVLIVVLAALAGFVASMVGGQSASQQLERTTFMVEAAAQTGVEWGKNRRSAGVLNCAASPSFTLASVSLNGIQIVVTCGVANKISSTATFGVVSSPDFVERTITEP
jgi:Tfp pilus assembly protein PilX